MFLCNRTNSEALACVGPCLRCSGESFDWHNLRVPEGRSRGWLLAGGLTAANVAEAVRILHPDVVDVSSGVTGADKLAKDRDLVQRFIRNAQLKGL